MVLPPLLPYPLSSRVAIWGRGLPAWTRCCLFRVNGVIAECWPSTPFFRPPFLTLPPYLSSSSSHLQEEHQQHAALVLDWKGFTCT
eukprot:3599699-Rhodomonas_salina.1